MFQKNYKTLELQGMLEFCTNPLGFTKLSILRLNIYARIPSLASISMHIWL